MNVFSERLENKRYRNRNPRFGCFGGLFLKIAVFLAILALVMGVTTITFDNIFWLFNMNNNRSGDAQSP